MDLSSEPFRYDLDQCEASWNEAGERHSYKCPA